MPAIRTRPENIAVMDRSYRQRGLLLRITSGRRLHTLTVATVIHDSSIPVATRRIGSTGNLSA